MKDWFHPTTQQYFSYLVKRKLAGGTFTQHRVLLFNEEESLTAANQQYLDAQYSKSLVDIHNNYEIPLAYLGPADLREVLENFELTKQAASWMNRKDNPKQESKGTLATLDFGLVGYPNEYKAFTFDKSGDSVTLKEIEDPTPYLKLRDEIKNRRVFNEKGLPRYLHNFAGHCGLTSLENEQPFVAEPEVIDAAIPESVNPRNK